jgi:hypothetical protein
MNINLHIERLILDGLPIEARQGALLKEAVEVELTRLLEQSGLSANLQMGITVPSLTAPSIQLNTEKNPTKIGQQIGQAIYKGVGDEGANR